MISLLRSELRLTNSLRGWKYPPPPLMHLGPRETWLCQAADLWDSPRWMALVNVWSVGSPPSNTCRVWRSASSIQPILLPPSINNLVMPSICHISRASRTPMKKYSFGSSVREIKAHSNMLVPIHLMNLWFKGCLLRLSTNWEHFSNQ